MKNFVARVSRRADLKAALVLALQLAEKGVDGLPIPGVKGCIGGILKIIEQEELQEANIETFRGLVSTITELQKVTVARLSKERNIPNDLKSDVEGFAKKLRDIPERYNERIGPQSAKQRIQRIKNFFSAADHAKALNGLAEDLKNAVQEFQISLLVNLRLLEQKRENDRLIDKLPVERKAFYNAYREHPIELCEPGTRISLLGEVAAWASGTGANHPRILWLNGRAGVGKSTIAKTLATRFDAEKMLGGSFMFSKPNGVTSGSKLCVTLAYQLACHLPEFRDHLAAAARDNETLIEAELPQQFEDLLAAPLSQLQSPSVTMIILDALDECTMRTPVLTSIVENIIRFPFLRILITSRPEYPIPHVLRRFSGYIREVDISDIPVSNDIAKFLRKRLSNAYNQIVCMTDPHQNQSWPADTDLASLVHMASNLFIFAATAVRFIGDERAADPQRRLETILRGQHAGRKHPLSGLDVMFQEILQNALLDGENDLHDRFQVVVGTIVFSSAPFSVNSLVKFLASKYSARDIRHSLKFLHSVLEVPEKDTTMGLQVYHKSFADFITDQNRCTLMEAYLQPSTHHTRMCLRYLEMAESEFFARSYNSGSWFLRDAYAKAANPILTVIHKFLWCWLHHLYALRNENLETQGVKQLALPRAQSFLKSWRSKNQSYSGFGKQCITTSPRPFDTMTSYVLKIENLLKKGIQMLNLMS